MKGTTLGRWLLVWLVAGGVAGFGTGGGEARGASRVLYETRFEPAEGFDPELTLVGQGGWLGDGNGGNGLVTNFFVGEGQQAFVGYTAPTNREDFLTVWRPVNHVPGPTNPPVVRFSVLMSVEDSTTTTARDDFRWSAYNVKGERFFSIDFDNEALEINYVLDDDVFVPTGQSFTNSQPYLLEVVVRLDENRWTASLDGRVVVTNRPVTTRGFALDFGDFDAVWAIRTPGSPGDNFLVFDNYRLVAEAAEADPPPRLEPLGSIRPGEFLVRCHGTPGRVYVLQGTADYRDWAALKTNTVPADGYFDHLDRGGGARRFYRLQQD
jgi:hypothetical protein